MGSPRRTYGGASRHHDEEEKGDSEGQRLAASVVNGGGGGDRGGEEAMDELRIEQVGLGIPTTGMFSGRGKVISGARQHRKDLACE